MMSLLLLSSCATIMNGPNQTIGIRSIPQNAFVWVDSQYVGKTPINVAMTRDNNHLVTLQLEGYEVYELRVTRNLSKWIWGNIIFGGFIGVAVDALTGSIYKLTPEQVQAELYGNNVYSAKTDDSYVGIVLAPNPSWEKIGELAPIPKP